MRSYRFIFYNCCAVLTLLCARCEARVVNVLAIEYPPFTTSQEPSNGIAFELLEKVTLNDSVKWRAIYAPPGRAAAIISSGEWCASFYPVNNTIESHSVVLSKSNVRIGLVRLAKEDTFSWQSLDELSDKSVALLRAKEDSLFAQQFVNAGMHIIFVEDIHTGLRLVKRNRVDFALSDNLSFSRQNDGTLQFSNSFLVVTPITLYVNPACDIMDVFDKQ